MGLRGEPSRLRLKTFGTKAVDEFLDHHGLTHIFRAHQEKSNGLRICDNARVMTIFSTSDYVGHQNGAGVIYLGFGSIRLIIKEPTPHQQALQFFGAKTARSRRNSM